jgi:hypothetical protein
MGCDYYTEIFLEVVYYNTKKIFNYYSDRIIDNILMSWFETYSQSYLPRDIIKIINQYVPNLVREPITLVTERCYYGFIPDFIENDNEEYKKFVYKKYLSKISQPKLLYKYGEIPKKMVDIEDILLLNAECEIPIIARETISGYCSRCLDIMEHQIYEIYLCEYKYER